MWKQKLIEDQIEAKKQQQLEGRLKIQQNLENLGQFIKYRNQATSFHKSKSSSVHAKKKKKKSTKRKTEELFSKFNDMQARFARLTKSPQKDKESCLNLASDSDAEFSFDSLEPPQHLEKHSEPILDVEEQNQIKEMGEIEKVMGSIVKAVVKIQKVWRGYKTRQILRIYRDYLQNDQDLIENLDAATPTPKGQVQYTDPCGDGYCESIQKCTEPNDLPLSSHKVESIKSNFLNRLVEESNWIEDNLDLQDLSLKSIQKHKKTTQQQKQKWQDMLEYISQLQKEGSNQDLKQILKNLKKMTVECSLECSNLHSQKASPLKLIEKTGSQAKSNNEILFQSQKSVKSNKMQQPSQSQQFTSNSRKNLFIEIPQSPKQESVELSELRQALGSERLIKLTQNSSPKDQTQSIFVQNPFYEFAQKKFRELLNRQNMDVLIQIREQALEERNKTQIQMIQDALAQKQISPKTFNAQNLKLEKWITKEKEELQKHKKVIEIGWKGLFETFMRTQRDLLFMSKLKQVTLITSFSSEAISNFKQITSNSHSRNAKTINQESGTMYLSSSLCESQEQTKVPKQSPSPSPRMIQHSYQPEEHLEWDDEMLYTSDQLDPKKLQHSQVIKVSSLLRQEPEYSEQQVQSSAILISNSIIASEVQLLYEEMLRVGVDISKGRTIKAIKTNLNQVKAYLQHLRSYLIKQQSEHQDNMITRVNIPLGPTPKELLRYMHYQDEDEIKSEDSQDYQHQAILLTEHFTSLEKQLMEEGVVDSSDEFLLELEHIHNKVIFDALNEALDYFRPYGLNGYPYPWFVSANTLKMRPIKNQRAIEGIVVKSCERVVDWATCLVGIIIDKHDSPFPKTLALDIDYLNQIKEERMLRMINQEIVENEEKWINYDEDVTEMMLDISQLVFEELMSEFMVELKGLQKSK